MSCQHAQTTWTTRQIDGLPVDVRVCLACQRAVSMTRIPVPVRPLTAGCCANCGGEREPRAARTNMAGKTDASPVCTGCGLSQWEDFRQHKGLARRAGSRSLARAGERALEEGRAALAVKLATAAWLFSEDEVMGRALRLKALAACGESAQALDEGMTWVSEDAPSFVGGIVGNLLMKQGRLDEALEATSMALAHDPNGRALRLDRAEVLFELGRLEESGKEARRCLDGHDAVAENALDLLERTLAAMLARQLFVEIRDAFNAGAPHTHRSSVASYIRACAEVQSGRASDARRWLVHALRLAPDDEEMRSALARLEERMGLATTATLKGR